jgi:hypothetical protein
MKVITNIRRLDLIHFNLALLPRLRSTYVTIGVIALAAATLVFWQHGVDETVRNWKLVGVVSLAAGVGGMLVGMVISMFFVVFTSSKSNGILGAHEYEIKPEGLFEKTDANEGFNKWSGIQEIRIVGPFLLFRISGYLFHVIPKRSFESSEKFQEFVQMAQMKWRRDA